MTAHQKCYILAPFTLMVTDFSLPQLPALCDLHNLQGRPVISLVVVDVAWVANPDAVRHPQFEVILLCAVHAVIEVGPADLYVPVLMACAAQKNTMSSALRW
jgi:hypothetical protein